MPSTRRSARLANAGSSHASSSASSSTKAGSKRKADASPKGKQSRKAQKSLDETVPNGNSAPDNNIEMKDDERMQKAPKTEINGAEKHIELKAEGVPKTTTNGAEKDGESGRPTDDETKDAATTGDTAEKDSTKLTADDSTKPSEGSKGESSSDLIKDKTARDNRVASNIIEKGIIYFFTRGRVNVDKPEGVQDLQRTYFVLRPIPTGAKLGEGPMDDTKCNRLIVLPKKRFPKTPKERFMAFIEKGKVSMSVLKEFFEGSDYETKTGDTHHTPAMTLIGEGVYAITETGRSGHLAYMLTIPKKQRELQHEIGIYSKGSFILSIKNPKNVGPPNTQLPELPDFPQDIMDDFRGLAWMPVHKSEYLDYPNAQLLLVGEHHGKFGSAVEGVDDQKESPEEEIEKLEDEDQVRVEKLDEEGTVYQDLHVRKEEYPEVSTTW